MTVADHNKLSDADFPTGTSRSLNHPKHRLLVKLVKEHVKEYRSADQKLEERSYQGRRMKSKVEIISMVVQLILPTNGGYYKRRLPNSTWVIDKSYQNDPQKIRKRVSNEFNKHIKKNRCVRRASSKPDFVDVERIQQEQIISPLKLPAKNVEDRNIVDATRSSKDAPIHSCLPKQGCAEGDKAGLPVVVPPKFLPLPVPVPLMTALMAAESSLAASEDWERVDVCSVLSDLDMCSVLDDDDDDDDDNDSFDVFDPIFLQGRDTINTVSHQHNSAATTVSLSTGVVTCSESFPSNETIYDADDDDMSWQPDTVDSILRTMLENLKDADVQHSCCRLLGDMARFNASIGDDSFVALKGPHTVLAAMRLHKDNATVQQMACYSLGQWASVHPANKTASVIAGCFESFLAAMTEHTTSAKVQSYTCFALAAVTQNHIANQSAPCSLACIQAAVESMKKHSDDAEVQYYGSLALGNMVRNHRRNQTIIGGEGGVEVVLEAMKRHVDDVHVQSSCCNALGCLVWKHPTNQSIAIACDDSLKLVVSSMDRHTLDPNVQCNGCFALGCLAYNNSDNQSALVAARVREKAVSLLDNHAANVRVVEASCHLLYSCCLLVAESDFPAVTSSMLFDDASLSLRDYAIISRAIKNHKATNSRIAACGKVLLRDMPSNNAMDEVMAQAEKECVEISCA